jgi:hypothetical protein
VARISVEALHGVGSDQAEELGVVVLNVGQNFDLLLGGKFRKRLAEAFAADPVGFPSCTACAAYGAWSIAGR